MPAMTQNCHFLSLAGKTVKKDKTTHTERDIENIENTNIPFSLCNGYHNG